MNQRTFNEVWERLHREERAQQKQRADEICANFNEPDGLPSGPDVAKALIWLPREYAKQILLAHPGHALAQLRSSYSRSLEVLEQGLRDLLEAIGEFEREALSHESTLFHPNQESRLRGVERRIQKELFAVASASHSLVDHTRRLTAKLAVPGFDAARLNAFGSDGQHEFVVELRNLLHHVKIVDAGYMTSWSAGGERSATFVLQKEDVQRALADNRVASGAKQSKIDEFLAKHVDTIDIRSLFNDYRARVTAFHDWLKIGLTENAPIALRDYDDLTAERDKEALRINWNMLLGNWLNNWKVPPNPHNHLHKYLTVEQLAAVYRLPRNSKAQVDLVIEFLDTTGAINDKLREYAYELFARAPQDEMQQQSPEASAPTNSG